MLLRANRTNPNEVEIVNGKAVAVDARKPQPSPRPSQPTGPGPSKPTGPGPSKPDDAKIPVPPKADVPPSGNSGMSKPPDGAKQPDPPDPRPSQLDPDIPPSGASGTSRPPSAKSSSSDRKAARNDERRNIAQIMQQYDWHKVFILDVLVLQSNNTTSLLAALLPKFELVSEDDEFQLAPSFYHGSLIPYKVISPNKLAQAIYCDQRFHVFLMMHIDADEEKMKEIDPEVFNKCSKLSLRELENFRAMEKDNLEGFFDQMKASLVTRILPSKDINDLLQRRKKVLLIDWFVARPRPDPTRGIALPHPAPDLPGMAERVRELQQTPVLYKAWLEETRLETACTGTITR